jgi:outer membrane protein
VNLTSLVARRLTGTIGARSIILGGLLAAGVMAVPAFAQTTQTPAQPAAPAQGAVPAAQIPVNIAILDSARVSNTSTVGKSLNDQVNAALNQIESDFRKKEQALQQQMQQLVAARSGNPPMTPADFEAKRKALVTQDQALQQNYDKSKKALGVRVDKARTKIGETLQKIVIDIATQRKLTLVLERTAAHLFVPQWDITQDVMARLNKALPSIKL